MLAADSKAFCHSPTAVFLHRPWPAAQVEGWRGLETQEQYQALLHREYPCLPLEVSKEVGCRHRVGAWLGVGQCDSECVSTCPNFIGVREGHEMAV